MDKHEIEDYKNRLDKNKGHNHSNGFCIGRVYSAIGTCGMTDGLEVKGVLTEIDRWGSYLTCERGIPHLCNTKTLKVLY